MGKQKQKPEIKSLYYITHVENLPSILSHGVLSHRYVEDHQIEYEAIDDPDIVSSRKAKITPDGHSLWEFANVYFQARNPMLYRIVHERDPREIVVLGIQPRVLETAGAYITNGNAANNATGFFDYEGGLVLQRYLVGPQ